MTDGSESGSRNVHIGMVDAFGYMGRVNVIGRIGLLRWLGDWQMVEERGGGDLAVGPRKCFMCDTEMKFSTISRGGSLFRTDVYWCQKCGSLEVLDYENGEMVHQLRKHLKKPEVKLQRFLDNLKES